MGKKKTEEGGEKSKQTKEKKNEKMSVSAMLASMDQIPNKAKKATSLSSTVRNPKPKAAPKVLSLYADIDLPPSDDEDDLSKDESQKGGKLPCRKERASDKNLEISHGKRYGLVGPNGKGKLTLLKLLAWRKIHVPKNIDVLLVEQEIVSDDRTVLESVVSANEELVRLRQELMVVDAVEAQASKILAGLGFTKVMQGRATRSFSGGWRMRISLARDLYVQLTLLILDEPTNHLDLRAVLWLEEYLCRWKKTLIVVSHDRDFLNTICSEIIHLYDLKLHTYRGNFNDFESGYEQRRKEMNKKFETYDKQVKATKKAGNQKQQQKVIEKGKLFAKEAKNKAKGKIDSIKNLLDRFSSSKPLSPPIPKYQISVCLLFSKPDVRNGMVKSESVQTQRKFKSECSDDVLKDISKDMKCLMALIKLIQVKTGLQSEITASDQEHLTFYCDLLLSSRSHFYWARYDGSECGSLA
ncbi:ABC transporter F family member 4 [Tanacetum coccineum]